MASNFKKSVRTEFRATKFAFHIAFRCKQILLFVSSHNGNDDLFESMTLNSLSLCVCVCAQSIFILNVSTFNLNHRDGVCYTASASERERLETEATTDR